MSGNDEQIDLNSDVDVRGRVFEIHGINLKHSISDSLNEKISDGSCSRELGKDDAVDVEEIHSSREGFCRLDKDEADENVGYEAVDVEILEGRSTEMVAAARIGEESSVVVNYSSDAEMESSERRHISLKVEAVRGDESIADDNAAGTLKSLQSDHLSCCDAKNQDGEGLVSLKKSTEDGVADAAIGCNVESQEDGICTVQDVEKVDQTEELAFDSVDVKCDQVVKEGHESHSILDHGGCIDVHININPEGPVDDSDSLRDNLGSDSPKTAGDVDEKAENLTESNELSPVLDTEVRILPTPDCLESQSENPATSSHILKSGALTDLDEANLFEVVVEVDPHVMMDADEISDDVGVDSADSVVEFNVSDLVWSRVPSHPWWPGQICDPAASSKKAMKYFRSGRYLVGFFGDHSFAWKEAVMIKPFQEYFLELQKQSNLKSFHEAIGCALEEFSRRVEYSLACTCLSEELYSKIQTQTLTNAGIRKKFSKRVGGDSSITASSFDPMKLINTVEEVAMSPFGEADKLELVRAQAQLLAFNRWKGYDELPKFDKHNVVFNDADHILHMKTSCESESIVDIPVDVKHSEAAISEEGNLKSQDSSGGKRKRKTEDLKDLSEKDKSLSNSTAKKPRRSWKKKHVSEENVGNELILNASSTKDEVVCNDTANIPIAQVESGKTNQTFRVGDRIQKAAYKLNESNPLLKHDDGISQKDVAKKKRGRKPKPKVPN